MNQKPNKAVWLIATVVFIPLLALGVVRWVETRLTPLPYYDENYQVSDKAQSLKVPPFRFINQDGAVISEQAMKGKVWVVCYFFTTCPTICPKMINGMKEVVSAYTDNEEFGMISFTVDPVHDTPEKLKTYARARALPTHRWHLVTGNKTDLYRFARKGLMLVATDGNGGPGDFIHSDKLVLIDQESRIRGYYDGTEPSEVKQLTRDIARL